jgi:hypothetical protein
MIRMPQRLVRSVKRVRNALRDFPPTHKSIIYEGYTVNFPEVVFRFLVGKKALANRVVLENFQEADLTRADPTVLDAILSHIGLAFVPFMFALEDFDSVLARTMPLSEGGREFFQDYFCKGLAELRYVQGLNVSKPIALTSGDSRAPWESVSINAREKALLMNGGGKDSAVAAELLKAMDVPFAWLTVDPNPVRRTVIARSGQEEAYGVFVDIDPAVRNEAKYRWGTHPYVALYNFISLLPAYLGRCRYVIVGNEYSSNFGNLVHDGTEINHQYSKSFEFETAFDRYARRSLLQDVHHFSLLRPFYELRIAQMFAHFPQYFDAFISCNVGLHKGRWCKECPKCAFICLAVSPFLTARQVHLIFGEDLFQRKTIRTHMLDLVNDATKPWECVGTEEECRLALALFLSKNPDLDFPRWPYRKNFEACCRGIDVQASIREHLLSFKDAHNIPPDLAERLRRAVEPLTSQVGV